MYGFAKMSQYSHMANLGFGAEEDFDTKKRRRDGEADAVIIDDELEPQEIGPEDDPNSAAEDDPNSFGQRKKAKLSPWAERFLRPRKHAPMVEMPIEPINDHILQGFGTKVKEMQLKRQDSEDGENDEEEDDHERKTLDYEEEDKHDSSLIEPEDDELSPSSREFLGKIARIVAKSSTQKKKDREERFGTAETPDKVRTREAPHTTGPTYQRKKYQLSDSRYFLSPTGGGGGGVIQRTKLQGSNPCWLCARTNHNAADCPTQMCFACLKPGHQARDCPNERVKVPSFAELEAQYLNSESAVKKTVSSLLMLPRPMDAKIYCYNCGRAGHLGAVSNSCHLLLNRLGSLRVRSPLCTPHCLVISQSCGEARMEMLMRHFKYDEGSRSGSRAQSRTCFQVR
jgi:hypothetical protein